MVKSGWKNVEEAFQHVWLFSYGMLNSSEVFLNVCSNEDSFSWLSNELMICWSISEVRFAWWNCGYQVHLLANKQAPQKLKHFLLLLQQRVGHFLYNALSIQSPWFFFIKLWAAMAMREHSKLRRSFQILYEFQPFSLKSSSMTAFCLSVKTCLVSFVWIGGLQNVQAKTSNFNRLLFALQWLLALPRLLYKAKTKEKLIQGSFKCWKQTFL